MKTILLPFICLIATLSQAQTAIIAHKSHSGSAADFFIDPSTNFGEPGPQLIQVVRLNDSTYINVYSEFSGSIYHDTILQKPIKKAVYDSIYQLERYKHIEYIIIKNPIDSGRIKAPGFRVQQLIEKTEIAPTEEETIPIREENTPKKKKKKSYLLFLVGITGGGILLMKLFKRSKNTTPSIA